MRRPFEPGETLRLVVRSWCVCRAWNDAEPKRRLTHTEDRAWIAVGDSRLRVPLLGA